MQRHDVLSTLMRRCLNLMCPMCYVPSSLTSIVLTKKTGFRYLETDYQCLYTRKQQTGPRSWYDRGPVCCFPVFWLQIAFMAFVLYQINHSVFDYMFIEIFH